MSINNIVVSRYNKNVDFIYKLDNVNVMVYDKENPNNPYNIPVNKGDEASVYLKYIVDHYHNLPDYTFFMHDEEYAWHHSGSIIDKYNEAVSSNELYYNINDGCIWKDNLPTREFYIKILIWYSEYIEKYIPISKVPNNIDFLSGYRGSAQFLVHRDLILNFPIEFYEKIYNWVISTDNNSRGYFLEYTWHIFWYIYPKYIKGTI